MSMHWVSGRSAMAPFPCIAQQNECAVAAFIGTSISCRAFRKSAPVILLFLLSAFSWKAETSRVQLTAWGEKARDWTRLLVAAPWRCDVRRPSRRVGARWIAVAIINVTAFAKATVESLLAGTSGRTKSGDGTLFLTNNFHSSLRPPHPNPRSRKVL